MRLRHLVLAPLAIAVALLGGTAAAGVQPVQSDRSAAAAVRSDGRGHPMATQESPSAQEDISGGTSARGAGAGHADAGQDEMPADMPGHDSMPGHDGMPAHGVAPHGGAGMSGMAGMSDGQPAQESPAAGGGSAADGHPGGDPVMSAAPGHGAGHENADRKQRPRALVLGGFVAVNLLVLTVASVLRRRPRNRRPAARTRPVRPSPVSPTA